MIITISDIIADNSVIYRSFPACFAFTRVPCACARLTHSNDCGQRQSGTGGRLDQHVSRNIYLLRDNLIKKN